MAAPISDWILTKRKLSLAPKHRTRNARASRAIGAFAINLMLIYTIIGQSYAQGIIKFGNDGKPGAETVFFGDTKYVIPKSYLPGITPLHKSAHSDFTKEHGYAAFSLQLGLPDLTPGMPDHDGIEGKGWGHEMRVLAEYGLHFRDDEVILELDLKNSKMLNNEYTSLENGCKLYIDSKIYRREIYFCEIQSRLLLVECSLPGSVPSPGCKVMENFSENSTVIYSYGRNFVDHAIEIDQKLRALIASFATPDAQNHR